MCYLAKFFVSCNEKLENFASLQKGDIIMPESFLLSDPSGPRSKTNHASLFALAESQYDTCIIIRLRLSEPITCSHHYHCTIVIISISSASEKFMWLNDSNIYHRISFTRWRIPIAMSFQYTRDVIYRYATFN